MLALIVISAGIAYFLSLPFASVLQGANYRLRTYFSRSRRYALFCAVYFAIAGTVSLLSSRLAPRGVAYAVEIFLYFTMGVYAFSIHKMMRMQLIVTNRLVRLLILSTILYAGMFLPFYFTDCRSIWSTSPSLAPFVTAFSAIFIAPFELMNNERYIKIAKSRLSKSGAIKVGITGSYGKTTVKHDLEQLLSIKYRTFATPANYNTPLGIAKCLEQVTGREEIMLLEMGARKRGDIRELCEMALPNIGVITGVAPQHLETFGSLENIIREKGELARSIPKECAVYYNLTDERVREMYDDRVGEKVGVGFERADYLIEGMTLSESGTRFVLAKSDVRIKIELSAVGIAATVDFALAAAIALDLGVDPEAIRARAKGLAQTPHRFEIVRRGDVLVIDDSYNINPIGASISLRSFAAFPAERRIVYTSGIVELGGATEEYNRTLGGEIAETADLAIVAEGRYGDAVCRGIEESGEACEILRVEGTTEASERFREYLRQGDALLIMSDLPRDYLL